MDKISTVQWVCIAGVAGLAIIPRLGSLKELLAALWAKIQALFNRQAVATTPDANAYAAAYRLIAPELDAQTATAVRVQLADMLLRGVTGRNTEEKKQ